MIVDLAREFGVSVFIYLSSQLVQNSFDDPNCKNEFFAGKLAVERYIQSSEEKSLSWMYVNIENGNIYALLTVLVVEFSVQLSTWRVLPVNRDPSSLEYSLRG